jgi:hypothetical protein
MVLGTLAIFSSIGPAKAESLGSWSPTSTYPISGFEGQNGSLQWESCVSSSGQAYYVGSGSNSVYYASLSGSGVGTWGATTSYPWDGNGGSCVAYSGDVYCINLAYDSVEYAPISGSGVGDWTGTASYPLDVTDLSCAADSGHIYCMGGQLPETSSDPSRANANAVYFTATDLLQVSTTGGGGTTTTTATTSSSTSRTSTTTSSTTSTSSSSTTKTTRTSTTRPTTVTTAASSGRSFLDVSSQNSVGSPITGYWTVLYLANGRTVLGDGYTPHTCTVNNGQAYTLEANSYGSCHFAYWLDTGSTNSVRTISITSNTQVTAVCRCGSRGGG